MSRSGPAALAWWYLLGWLCSSSTGAGVHAVLETSFAGRVQEQVVPTRKGCPRPCINKGHCNHEKGRCECPWGYAGDACEVDRMAACRQTPDDPGSCGFISPKNCECFRECFRLYCSRYGTQTHKCSAGWGFDIGDSPCWLYGSGGSAANGTAAGGGGGSSVAVLPAAAQNSSAYPEDPENNTVWYSQVPAWSGLAYSGAVRADGVQTRHATQGREPKAQIALRPAAPRLAQGQPQSPPAVPLRRLSLLQRARLLSPVRWPSRARVRLPLRLQRHAVRAAFTHVPPCRL
eukprot:XP_001693349.1 hypothetical protein CHLREDRAFT_205511 [Chlamydomonas reinhardtii]